MGGGDWVGIDNGIIDDKGENCDRHWRFWRNQLKYKKLKCAKIQFIDLLHPLKCLNVFLGWFCELRKMFTAVSLQVWRPAIRSFKGCFIGCLGQQQRFRINPCTRKCFVKSGQGTVYCRNLGCVCMHKIQWPL